MNNQRLCPKKFSNPQAWAGPYKDGWECEGQTCGWWCSYTNACAIPTIASSLQAIRETMKTLVDQRQDI